MVAKKITATEKYAFMIDLSGCMRTLTYPASAGTNIKVTVLNIWISNRREAFGTAVIAILFRTNKAEEETPYKATRVAIVRPSFTRRYLFNIR